MRIASILLVAAAAPLAAQTPPAKSTAARSAVTKSRAPAPVQAAPAPVPLDSLDPLRQALDSVAAIRLRAVISAANNLGLSGGALESRVLRLAARGVPVAGIERSVGEEWARMSAMRGVLQRALARTPDAGEVEAAAELARRGVDPKRIAELATSAPAGRSLALPLLVAGSFVDLGQPADSVLARLTVQLSAGATDREIERGAAALNAVPVYVEPVATTTSTAKVTSLDTVVIEETREVPSPAKTAAVPPARAGPGDPARPTGARPRAGSCSRSGTGACSSPGSRSGAWTGGRARSNVAVASSTAARAERQGQERTAVRRG
jgi:hypothetical protein